MLGLKSDLDESPSIVAADPDSPLVILPSDEDDNNSNIPEEPISGNRYHIYVFNNKILQCRH